MTVAPCRPAELRAVESAATAHAPLIERDGDLEVLASGVRRAAAGAGAVVVLEAPAGMGKTALLEAGVALAVEAGCLVRRAAPGPSEGHFAFGVVRALFEAPVRESAAAQRAHLLDGAAAAAGELLLGRAAPAGDSPLLLAHSVLWLCAALAEHRPLMLVVDDAQWADRASLEVLAYLARRVEDLPMLIVIAARADDPDAAADVLSLLGSARSATVLAPRPLTPAGAAQLVRAFAPEANDDLCRACHRAAGGNPWLLGELARQVAAHGSAAVDEPGTVARDFVRRRVAELCPRDRGVAEALAVIGDGTRPHVVAAVAGVALGDLGSARDALTAAGLLAADGERFAHGLIGTAIAAELSRTRREQLHRETARALAAAGVDLGLVAGHLLACAPHADPEVSDTLMRAASAAGRRGEPGVAAAYLERALAERAPGDDRGALLVQLSTLGFDAGLPDVRGRLREALDEVRDSAGRIEVLTRLAALSLLEADDDGLGRLIERELAAERDPDVRLAVETAALDALMIVPARHAERARRVAAITHTRTADPLLARVVLAHRAWVGVEGGKLDAQACAALALEALDGDLLLEQVDRRSAYVLSARTLVMTDHPGAVGALAALHEHAVARGSVRLRAAHARYAAEFSLRRGDVAEAEIHARLVLDLAHGDVNVFTGGAVEVLVTALAERGAFEEAHELLREHRLDGAPGSASWEIGARHARARLWLAEGDFERAFADALHAGSLRLEQGRINPSLAPWRTTAALALAHLGRRTEAVAVADAELGLAQRFGAPVPIAAALHARAVAEPDPIARIALCERAVAVAPVGLEPVRARLELGSTLDYLRRRIEARNVLRPALAEADEAGAVLLAQRARRELVATGLRPRHAAVEGAGALTPRQREICELAAAGKSNREIAQALFLSVKTVETHLAAGYRKLGVSTRTALARELAA